MSRIAYVNGQYQPISDASVNVEDRGYQFADAVYDAFLVKDGHLFEEDGHLARLERSLAALEIPMPMSRAALKNVIRQVLRRNRLNGALLYIQVSRGVAPRNHPFPAAGTEPTIVVTARRFDLARFQKQCEEGVAVVSQPDIRWGRVNIKSVGLLPNVLAKQAAVRAGAVEAWLVRDGKVTEGGSSNSWIINKQGEIVTHPATNEILGGITRSTVIKCAEALQMKVVERPFTLEEALGASEAFLSSAGNFVTPVISIDGKKIGSGKPGPIVKRLQEAYIADCLTS